MIINDVVNNGINIRQQIERTIKDNIIGDRKMAKGLIELYSFKNCNIWIKIPRKFSNKKHYDIDFINNLGFENYIYLYKPEGVDVISNDLYNGEDIKVVIVDKDSNKVLKINSKEHLVLELSHDKRSI